MCFEGLFSFSGVQQVYSKNEMGSMAVIITLYRCYILTFHNCVEKNRAADFQVRNSPAVKHVFFCYFRIDQLIPNIEDTGIEPNRFFYGEFFVCHVICLIRAVPEPPNNRGRLHLQKYYWCLIIRAASPAVNVY